MATHYSNIDDVLAAASNPLSQATLIPEEPPQQQEEVIEFGEDVTDEQTHQYQEESQEQEKKPEQKKEAKDDEQEEHAGADEYGNEIEQEEENAGVRKRISKMQQRHQAEINALKQQLNQVLQNPQQLEQAAENAGFEYDENSNESWDKQLKRFVKQVFNEEATAIQRNQQQQEEIRNAEEYRARFASDMDRFDDFEDVINTLPVSDIPQGVVSATMGMKNPASFLYAAAKRMPQELARICNIRNPYEQALEIGRLESKLRVKQAPTSGHKPMSKAVEDGRMPQQREKKHPNSESIDDLIAASERKRADAVAARSGMTRNGMRGRR